MGTRSRRLPLDKVSTLMIALGLAILSTAFFPPFALAADDDLDRSFGENGLSVLDRSQTEFRDVVRVEAGRHAGKIVAVGSVYRQRTRLSFGVVSRFLVARFRRDGALDRRFGNDGLVKVDFRGVNLPDRAKTVAIDSEGNVLVGGGCKIARLRPNGRLDSSFGNDGRVVVKPCEGGIADLAVYPEGARSGQVLAVGESFNGSSSRVYLERFRADGSVDESFRPELQRFADPRAEGESDSSGEAVEIFGEKVVVVGTQTDLDEDRRETRNFGALRLEADGSADPSFAEDGRATYDFDEAGAQRADVQSAALYQSGPDAGKLLIAGSPRTNLGTGFAVLRIAEDGSLDRSFAGDGTTFVRTNAWASDVVLDPKMRIALLGTAIGRRGGVPGVPEGVGVTLVRLSPDGAPDPNFGRNGVSITTFTEGRLAFMGGIIGNGSRLTVAGTFGDFEDGRGFLARFGDG